MSIENDLSLALSDLVNVLARHGIDYFVTGSVASSVRGEYRATNDVDIVADMHGEVVERFIADASIRFVADEEQAREALRTGESFSLIHRETFLKVDIFLRLTAFEREVLSRAATISLPGTETALRVATTEDILLAKLRCFRLGGEESSVQRRDITALVALNRDELDQAYIRFWAPFLGVADLAENFVMHGNR